jgi:hypothetical protein
MNVMIFGESPVFHHIVGSLVTLEADIKPAELILFLRLALKGHWNP